MLPATYAAPTGAGVSIPVAPAGRRRYQWQRSMRYDALVRMYPELFPGTCIENDSEAASSGK